MNSVKSFTTYLIFILLPFMVVKINKSLDPNLFSISKNGLNKVSLYKANFLSADLYKTKDGDWLVNGSSKADEKMTSLLSAILNSIEIVERVNKSEKVEIVKELKQKGVIIEYYQDHLLSQSIFIGEVPGKPDHSYAWIEGERDPFIVRVPDAKHNLENLISLENYNWKDRQLLSDAQEVQSIQIDYFNSPKDSFEIRKLKEDFSIDGHFVLKNNFLVSYFSEYKKLEASGLISTNEMLLDSLKLSTPFCQISIKEKDINKSRKLNIYLTSENPSIVYGQMEHQSEVFFIPIENIKSLLVTKEFLLGGNS